LNQKDIVMGSKENEDDNETLRTAEDQGFIQVSNTQQFGTFRIGGLDQGNMAYMGLLREWDKAHSGGLDMLAGTSPMSDTATQDKMLMAQATQQVSDMQRETVSFAKGILEDLVFYLTRQPGVAISTSQRVAGIDIPAVFRSDEFDETIGLDITVSPTSMQDQTNAAIMQTITGIVQQFVGHPILAQQMQAQGKQLDVGKLIEITGELTNTEPYVQDIIIGIDPSVQEQMGPIAEHGQSKPANTSREVVRKTIPGSSERGKSEEMVRGAMGNNSQPAMMDQMNRPTG